MAIVRWDPFDAFLGAQDDLNRLFRRSWLRAPGGDKSLSEAGTWAPAVEKPKKPRRIPVAIEKKKAEPPGTQKAKK